ncbi:unnamed protein product [Schistosoma margrebowiei]|uniref:GRIP domain-containing protein n=1 Tax=Schistosoma margrebowiei TaxID=48269 RepID=A0AA84ZAN2_9TREM|nr:unnamed protein product [Schistosoma margrebowiei]
MFAPSGSLGNSKLDEVLAKDIEVKQLLHNEINELKINSDQLQKNLDLKTSQFEKLKHDFIFNFRLIKERDLAINKLNQRVSSLINNIHSRDILISEIKVSLDRTQSELAQVKSSEAKLREDIEESLHETVKREQKLLEKHNAIIEVLRKTETEERIKLQNNINRLQSELEKERLHATVELQTAIDDAVKEKERLRADTAQKIFDLELRIHLANESVELANKTKHDYIKELSCKEEEICNLNCTLNEMNKIVESQRLEIRDLHTRLNESKLKQVLLESTKAQNEELVTSQKAELTEEIDKLKLTLQHSDEKILTITTNYEEQVNSLQIDKQHLIESLNQSKQEIQNILKLWNEEKIKYQHAQYNIQMLQIQIKHLNDDLKQALLIKPDLYLNKDNQHDHLIEQLNSITNHCNQLENENIQLKQTINIMSEQAKQFAQLSIINDNDYKLSKAIKQIYRLSIEKQSLIELSNRLQSKLRQLNQYQKQQINNNGDLNNIQNSMINHINMIDVKNMKKPLNNNNESITMIKDNLNHTYLDNDQKQQQYHMTDDVESIITGKGSISTIFKLLDEVHSLDSENDIENLYGNRLIIQGKHKFIHNSKV